LTATQCGCGVQSVVEPGLVQEALPRLRHTQAAAADTARLPEDQTPSRFFFPVIFNRSARSQVIINNNNNSRDNVYGAVIMTKVIARVHPVHLMNVD